MALGELLQQRETLLVVLGTKWAAFAMMDYKKQSNVDSNSMTRCSAKTQQADKMNYNPGAFESPNY